MPPMPPMAPRPIKRAGAGSRPITIIPTERCNDDKIKNAICPRRDQPVICETCGRKVERRMRGQRYCKPRCRDRGRGRSRKAFLGKDTRAPASPTKISSASSDLQRAKTPSSSKAKVSLARVIQVEIIDRHHWEERTSPDGVKVWVAQLSPRYRYKSSTE